MKFIEAEIVVPAPPESVWKVLVDAGSWPIWDSGVEHVDGRIALGERITIRSSAAPGRGFPVTVTTFDSPRTLVLSGGMPLGLFRGVRTYTLAAEPGGTRFRMREEYTGVMLPMIWRSMPDLQPSFDRFAAGIAARAGSDAPIEG
ncbi:SRPBCC family protein [uncultured Amnibacterium sp.]|uniref:SRPBCC family protein n=1 Tax=uncultured Amnibacterium sp. TaxID=1631851 RepID=UPI0035C960A6